MKNGEPASNALDDLSGILAWDAENTVHQVNSVSQQYTESCVKALLEAIGLGFSEADHDGLYQSLNALDHNSLLRIVQAPELNSHLVRQDERAWTQEFSAFLNRSIKFELCCSASVDTPVHAFEWWSALGDKVLSREATDADVILWEAPVICGKIPLDVRSPYARRIPINPELSSEVVVPYGPELEMTLFKKLEDALLTIFEVSPSTAEFILASTAVVTCRPDDINPFDFTSASSRTYVGKITLVNAHLGPVNRPVLIDALIHEAVHSFLYKLEFEEPFVADHDDGWRIKIQSPWSGKQLRLTTYVHACFVYYALFQFWKPLTAGDTLNETDRNERLKFLHSGFARNVSVLSSINRYHSKLRPGLMNQLYSVTNYVLDHNFGRA